jgi:hypothetical protein
MLVAAHLAGRLSGRVLRLFACASCRRIAHLFDDRACMKAVMTAELHAVGRLGDKRLAKARNAATWAAEVLDQTQRWRHWREGEGAEQEHPEPPAARAAAHAADEEVTKTSPVFGLAVEALGREAERVLSGAKYRKVRRRWPFLPERPDPAVPPGKLVRDHVVGEQCDLLREVVGNPFRALTFEPGWLRWNGGWLPRLARTLFDENRFDELPIIGDALEDLGCGDEAILRHCRGPGPHVRGCFVVRLLLGLG